MPADRALTVNADDFGFTKDVNAGIVEAHTRGILTSTTLMANGAAFEDALRLARLHPALDIGVHFVLVQGESLVSGNPLPATVSQLLQALALRRIDVYGELRAQILKIVEAGIRPTHLDTHKHTHLLPPVLDAAARLAGEFGVRWVRRPMDLPLHGSPAEVPWKVRAVSRAFGLLRSRFHRKLSEHGCRTTDHFAGFQLTGRYSAEDILHLLGGLPAGSTEFMTHPGKCTAELRSAVTRLKQSRESELRALTDPRVAEAIRAQGIRLTPYSTL
jgi:predicted glycoside hydrolase/deacetylase ChbG (UPF0249 family)